MEMCIVHFAQSGSEPTQQLNFLRYNKTLASLQLDKQNTIVLTTQ